MASVTLAYPPGVLPPGRRAGGPGGSIRRRAYEWLVVAGARAQFKGSGTINGAGDYGFMLTAIDGALPGGNDADKFRIKIWDRETDAMIPQTETQHT